MRKIILLLLVSASFHTFAHGIHLSPEARLGPYWGSGISGGGIQLGVTDTFGLDALYLSYSHLSAEFLTDHDRLKTYRIGGQYNLPSTPMLGVQLEVGMVDYEGSRTIFDTQYRQAKGVSTAFAWVLDINDNLGFRAGMDLNFISKNKAYLSSPVSTTFNTGIVLRF